jgi:hypothetical protein
LFVHVGTSTGAILAAFLATKGGACEEAFLNPSDAKLKARYMDSMKQFKTAKGMEHSTYISPGQWMAKRVQSWCLLASSKHLKGEVHRVLPMPLGVPRWRERDDNLCSQGEQNAHTYMVPFNVR